MYQVMQMKHIIKHTPTVDMNAGMVHNFTSHFRSADHIIGYLTTSP